LYIISLAWLGFEIALLKGLVCNCTHLLEKARTASMLADNKMPHLDFFGGGPTAFYTALHKVAPKLETNY